MVHGFRRRFNHKGKIAMTMYTMQDWRRDKVLKLTVGQEVDDPVAWQLRDCVPPVNCTRSYLQVGEAKTIDEEFVNLYDTFERDSDNNGPWVYLGACRVDERKPRECYFEKYYKMNS